MQRIHPDDQARCRELVAKALQEKVDFAFDYRIIHPDKGVRVIHNVGHPVLDRAGDLVELLGTIVDITERKRMDEEREAMSRDLQESKSRLEEAERVEHLGYWEWDLVTDRVIWSDETYRIYGQRPEGLATCHDSVIYLSSSSRDQGRIVLA